MNQKKRLILSLLVALLLLIVPMLSACGGKTATDDVDNNDLPDFSEVVYVEGKTVEDSLLDQLQAVEIMKEDNEDSIGWLWVPNMDIDDVVLQYPDTSNRDAFYLRRDFNKEYDFNGSYFVDYRYNFENGTINDEQGAVVIYGHALTDDPENTRFNVKFGPLHLFRDPEYARDTPYIYFSTENENLAYEVVAVFVANSDNPDLNYNYGGTTPQEYTKMVKEEILPRSIYNYNVDIKDDDRYLVLSTCIYTLPDGTPTGYPNTWYRYAVIARLADPSEPLKKEAAFTINEDALVDPDGQWKS